MPVEKKTYFILFAETYIFDLKKNITINLQNAQISPNVEKGNLIFKTNVFSPFLLKPLLCRVVFYFE